MNVARGRIYRADIGYGLKPFLVVSNNRRNAQLQDVLAIRLTTSVKPEMPSIVVLDPADPMGGRALCDDVVPLFKDEIKEDLGAVTRATMQRVSRGLAHALSL